MGSNADFYTQGDFFVKAYRNPSLIQDKIKGEVKVLQDLKDVENISTLRKVATKDENITKLFFDYVPDSYSLSIFEEKELPFDWNLTEQDIKELQLTFLETVKEINERGYYHNDLTSPNIIVHKKDTGGYGLYIIDFDMATKNVEEWKNVDLKEEDYEEYGELPNPIIQKIQVEDILYDLKKLKNDLDRNFDFEISEQEDCYDYKDYKGGKIIGFGGFAKEIVGMYSPKEEKTVVFKVISLEETSIRRFKLEALLCEVASKKDFGPKFEKDYTCKKSGRKMGVIITEKMDGNCNTKKFTWEDFRSLNWTIKHMHDSGIFHLDLYPKNILYSGKGEYKIADYGLAIPLVRSVPNELRAYDYASLLFGRYSGDIYSGSFEGELRFISDEVRDKAIQTAIYTVGEGNLLNAAKHRINMEITSLFGDVYKVESKLALERWQKDIEKQDPEDISEQIRPVTDVLEMYMMTLNIMPKEVICFLEEDLLSIDYWLYEQQSQINKEESIKEFRTRALELQKKYC